jgi:uncharacterized protein (TIGR03085 family)
VADWHRTERAAIADLLEEVGPDAPTLCEGWTAHHLAAHLVLRERRPVAALGIVFSPLTGRTERTLEKLRAEKSLAELVKLIRTGPPPLSPIRFVPGLDALTNTVEYVVHHEDVRRGRPGWEPRELDPELEHYLWSRLKRGASLMFRKAPVGVVLEDGDSRIEAKADDPVVTVRGTPCELTLLAFGRGANARLDYDGDPAGVAELRSSSFGI